MTNDSPKDVIEQRARDLARRVMAKPPAPRVKPQPTKARDDGAKPKKRAPVASES